MKFLRQPKTLYHHDTEGHFMVRMRSRVQIPIVAPKGPLLSQGIFCLYCP